jgi:hypothetical protein
MKQNSVRDRWDEGLSTRPRQQTAQLQDGLNPRQPEHLVSRKRLPAGFEALRRVQENAPRSFQPPDQPNQELIWRRPRCHGISNDSTTCVSLPCGPARCRSGALPVTGQRGRLGSSKACVSPRDSPDPNEECDGRAIERGEGRGWDGEIEAEVW